MGELTLGPWTVGIDHVSGETNLPRGAAKDVVNLDIDRVGTLQTRAGYTSIVQELGLHSLWSGVQGAYLVRNGALCSAAYDGTTLSTSALYTLDPDLPVSYDDLLDGVVAATKREVLYVGAGVRHLGIENPGAMQASAETYGGLLEGRYGVAVSYLRGGEESGLSYGSFVQVPSGGGLRLTLPRPLEGEVDGLRLYRTQANGDVYYRVNDLLTGLPSYLLGVTDLGRAADHQFLERLPGGQFVRYWRGHVLIARGNVLLFSQPLRYGLYDPRHDFAQFERPITLLEPVTDGVFVGSADGVVFLVGQRPGDWRPRRTGAKAPIAGTGTRVDATELADEVGARGERVALWLSRNGFVIGTGSGGIVEVQGRRIRLPAEQTSGIPAMVSNRRALAVVS